MNIKHLAGVFTAGGVMALVGIGMAWCVEAALIIGGILVVVGGLILYSEWPDVEEDES